MLNFWKKKQFWGGLIAIALLWYCLKDISFAEIQHLSDRLNYWYVIPALASAFLFQILRALRWRAMVAKHVRIRVIQGASLYAAGTMLNSVMPALTGQVGRMILFHKQAGLRKTFVFSTLVLEVLFDAISLILIIAFTSIMFEFPEGYDELSYIVVGVTALGVILLYLILRFQQQLEDLGRRRLRESHPGVYITILKFIRSFTKGIDLLRSSEHFFATLFFSLSSWIAHVAVIYFLFLSFGLDLEWTVAAGVMVIATIALMVPITPGNAGTFETVISRSVIGLAKLSAVSVVITRTDAVLFALALHLVDLVPIFTLGMTYIHFQKMSLFKIRKEHEDARLLDKISEDGTLIEEEEQV
jgi:uncharacterized protein (TIRG00374 family)